MGTLKNWSNAFGRIAGIGVTLLVDKNPPLRWHLALGISWRHLKLDVLETSVVLESFEDPQLGTSTGLLQLPRHTSQASSSRVHSQAGPAINRLLRQ